MSKIFTIIIGLLVPFLATLAVAVDLDYVFADTAQGIANGSITITVTPGAGLPSLESLGLTEYDLFKSGPPPRTRQLYERGNPLNKRYACFPVGTQPTVVTGVAELTGVLANWAYLYSLGTTPCVITQRPLDTAFVTTVTNVAGLTFTTTIDGQAACDVASSSYCVDVATALETVIDECEVCGEYFEGYGPICSASGGGVCIWQWLHFCPFGGILLRCLGTIHI